MRDPNAGRAGYKETKVGWIPEEWEIVALEKVAEVQTGLAKGKRLTGMTVSLPYLRVANVQDGHVALDDLRTISVAEGDVERYRLRSGDVLFTEGGDYDKLGRGCVWGGQVDPCLHQNHVFAVRCDTEQLLPGLLASHAAADHGRRYFTLSSKQSTNLASINSSQLKAFPVCLPPTTEQHRIVEVLETCDRAIERIEKILEAKERQKKALMQQLLGQRVRLSGYSCEWGRTRLGALFSERTETDPGLPLLAISGRRGIVPATQLKRKDSSNADKRRYKVIRPGDIGYNTMRMWQGVSAVSRHEGIVSPAYTVCIPSREVDVDFMAHFFRWRPTVHLFWRYSQGLVDDTLSLKYPNFAAIPVVVPKKGEQKAIAEALEAADEELACIERRSTALKRQKVGLMQKLLTGQVRVKV